MEGIRFPDDIPSEEKKIEKQKKWKPKLGGPKTLKDLDLYVRFSIVIAIIFTIAVLIIFIITGAEPDTLITCFFAMFGGEVFFCAMIKLFKLHTEEKIRQGMEEDKEPEETD